MYALKALFGSFLCSTALLAAVETSSVDDKQFFKLVLLSATEMSSLFRETHSHLVREGYKIEDAHGEKAFEVIVDPNSTRSQKWKHLKLKYTRPFHGKSKFTGFDETGRELVEVDVDTYTEWKNHKLQILQIKRVNSNYHQIYTREIPDDPGR